MPTFQALSPTDSWPTQLYSTASYKQHDLHGINLNDNDLSGWDFTDQNLMNARFTYSGAGAASISSSMDSLHRTFGATGSAAVDLSRADLRGALISEDQLAQAITTNTIFPDGSIKTLDLTGGLELVIRDHNGRQYEDAPYLDLPPIPITVDAVPKTGRRQPNRPRI